MRRTSNTRRFSATESQVVRNLDRKRAILKVIGRRPMKCNECASEHLLVAEGAHILVLNPCAALKQVERS